LTWKIIFTDSPGTSTRYGGNDFKKVMQYFTGYELSDQVASDRVDINSNTTFGSERLRIKAPTSGFSYIFKGKDIAADRIITLPLMTGDGEMSLAASSTVNDWGNNLQTFRHQNIAFRNPANTFSYIVNTGAILANRNVSFPVLNDNDTFVFTNATQTLENKTLVNPTISTFVLYTDTNTLRHSATNNAGDILINTGTKYDRFPRGGANQFLATNSLGTNTEWRDISSISGGGGGGGGSSTGDHLVPIAGNQITGAWYGTSTTGASGVWSGFLNNATNIIPTNISDTSGRIGLRYPFTNSSDRAGFRTADEYFTLANNPELFVRYKMLLNSQSDDYRIVIGFTSDVSSTTTYGTDNSLNNKSAFMWFKETADTLIQVGRNDGDATQDKNSALVSLSSTDENVNTVRIIGDAANNRFGISLNSASFEYFTTEIPAATTRLGCVVQIENEDSADRFCEIYGAYWKGTVI
jgi:hypothetical protein